jgi:small subunit ribosomal protein S20
LATKSAAKAARKSQRGLERNQALKSALKTFIRQAQEAIARKDIKEAGTLVKKAERSLDAAAIKGIIHPNGAARRKSRLLAKFNQAFPSGPGA